MTNYCVMIEYTNGFIETILRESNLSGGQLADDFLSRDRVGQIRNVTIHDEKTFTSSDSSYEHSCKCS